MTRRRHKASLRGWWRWLPFLLIPFSVFFFETWLRTETIMMGYKVNELDVEIRKVRERVDDLENQAADLERMERINRKARDYGLVEPKPNQTEVIVRHVRRQDPAEAPEEPEYSLAEIWKVTTTAGGTARDGDETP